MHFMKTDDKYRFMTGKHFYVPWVSGCEWFYVI